MEMRLCHHPAIAVLGAVLGLAGSAASLGAQDAIRPAEEIRVAEVANAFGARREVVADLWPDEVLRIQVELARAGYDPGVRTGRLDSETRRALTRFQAARRLVICGCPSYETVVALGIPPVVVVVRTYPAYGRERVVVVVPGGRRHLHRGGAAVIVGHSPVGVGVGHDPARGAGQIGRRFPPPRPAAPEPRIIYGPPTRPGGRIRPGSTP